MIWINQYKKFRIDICCFNALFGVLVLGFFKPFVLPVFLLQCFVVVDMFPNQKLFGDTVLETSVFFVFSTNVF